MDNELSANSGSCDSFRSERYFGKENTVVRKTRMVPKLP